MDPTTYNKPNAFERRFNKFFGVLVRLGLALPHNYLVVVRGRKSGREYANPVDVLDLNGRRFLVAPRGATEWSRNALAAGEVVLKKGVHAEAFAAVPLPDEQKPEILKAYLERFSRAVKRYFPVSPGAPAEAFRPLAPRYPVFELRRKG
ncbi:MAG TPA: nitroreductase/quinone reductase family protein [Candidatus Binatia bacterium]|nr:nitroreductase/quinone reductase family protein [Candidatus Binatia bacterium]